MQATDTEIKILRRLSRCRFLPGSFDKKFPKQVDLKNVSPLQKWWIYKLGYKYRKQIGNDALAFICKNYIDSNQKPPSRKESTQLLRTISRATKPSRPSQPSSGQLPLL